MSLRINANKLSPLIFDGGATGALGVPTGDSKDVVGGYTDATYWETRDKGDLFPRVSHEAARSPLVACVLCRVASLFPRAAALLGLWIRLVHPHVDPVLKGSHLDGLDIAATRHSPSSPSRSGIPSFARSPAAGKARIGGSSKTPVPQVS